MMRGRERTYEALRVVGAALLLCWGSAAEAARMGPLVVDLATYADGVRIDGEDADDLFPASATSCDLNGDGLPDLALGAAYGSGVGEQRRWGGEVYVMFGHRGRWASSLRMAADADVRIVAQDANDSLGMGAGCGDIDGDRIDDLVICAPGSDGKDNQRNGAGQAHILFGRREWPALVDLATDPGTVIWGEVAGNAFCYRPRIGDANGDGTADLLLDDDTAKNRLETFREAGRAYILFGRATWPAEIDLLLEDADVTFYGCSAPVREGDRLGSGTSLADLDRDGTMDVIVGAWQGDGEGNDREAAGDIYVYRGRPVWERDYVVCQQSAGAPDTYLYGRDAWDSAGDTESLTVGDLDADGTHELVVGASWAAGESNLLYHGGETYIQELAPPWPTVIDLRMADIPLIYGDQAEARCGTSNIIVDIDHDGRDDLAMTCGAEDLADGRAVAGEVAIFTHRGAWPAVNRLANGDADVLILGARAGDALTGLTALDGNADGRQELVVGAIGSHVVGAAWILDWSDADGDGIAPLHDTCPLVFDPAQADGDGDGLGDACAADYDGDGQADAADCAPNDRRGGVPPEVTGVTLAGATTTALTWPAAPFADRYDVTRGDLAALGPGAYGACRTPDDPDPADTRFEDAARPTAGAGFFYLVRGTNDLCGVAGGWGADAGGAPRVNHDPDACRRGIAPGARARGDRTAACPKPAERGRVESLFEASLTRDRGGHRRRQAADQHQRAVVGRGRPG